MLLIKWEQLLVAVIQNVLTVTNESIESNETMVSEKLW